MRWEPGFLGDLFIGSVSGGAFWGFISTADSSPHTFAGALIAGASGGSLLLSWVEQQTHKDERRHLADTLDNTLSELQKLKKQVKGKGKKSGRDTKQGKASRRTTASQPAVAGGEVVERSEGDQQ